jgi:hypothetical protein
VVGLRGSGHSAGAVYDVLKPAGSSSHVSSDLGGAGLSSHFHSKVKVDEGGQEHHHLPVIRETVSDEEEGRLSLNRKVDMLNVRDANEEFEMKSQCLRRKSLDFEREREKAKHSLGHSSSGKRRHNFNSQHPEDYQRGGT